MSNDGLDEFSLAWDRNHFQSLAEGGTWGVPRSGLVFTKRHGKLILTATMPHDPSMPMTAKQLKEYQKADFDGIKRSFEAAGIPVEQSKA